jgi:hypothetical protein
VAKGECNKLYTRVLDGVEDSFRGGVMIRLLGFSRKRHSHINLYICKVLRKGDSNIH